jgi:hypothetical protein
MIKTHNNTGLKYLCYTRKVGEEYDNYKGSGTLWLSHLNYHGDDISTELLFESKDYNEFVIYARAKSIEFDIVNSKEWANLKLEEGDGGDTVSNKKWITNGKTDKYIDKDIEVYSGWKLGRTNCIFNDKETQKKFNRLANHQTEKQKSASRLVGLANKGKTPWLGKRHSDKTKKMLSELRKKRFNTPDGIFNSIGEACSFYNTSRTTMSRWARNKPKEFYII